MSSAKRHRPTVEEVRTAVVHLVELAAAFEGRGASLSDKPDDVQLYEHFGWEPPVDSERFDDDERCIADVVRMLTQHREKQRLRQRNAILERLLYLLDQLYTAFRDEAVPAHERRRRLDLTCLQFWISPDAESLMPREQDLGAPMTAAKNVLEATIGLSESTFAKIRSEPQPLDDARRPFGRWVPRHERADYVAQLHQELAATTEREPVPLWALKELDEPLGLLQDRRVEAFIGEVGSDLTQLDNLLPAQRREALRGMVATEQQAVLAELKAAITSGDLSSLPEYLRQSALEYRPLCRTDSEAARAARAALDRALERASWERASTQFRELVLGATGPLDATPLQIVEAIERFEANLTGDTAAG
ncbi:MAG: hypothetical protein IPM35_02475 [Myxococcales bacterium]|nr:hypothetical protein [Myxococcales bacterium]